MKKTLFRNKVLLVSLSIIVLASLFAVYTLNAQSPNIFGGFVTSSIFCTCSAGFLLTISPPVGGQFVYQIGTPQFPYGRLPSPGVWTLGLYEPGGVCLMEVVVGCAPFGFPIGTITPIVGTSL